MNKTSNREPLTFVFLVHVSAHDDEEKQMAGSGCNGCYYNKQVCEVRLHPRQVKAPFPQNINPRCTE